MAGPTRLNSGGVLQSAIPKRQGPAKPIGSLTVRGAVMATYVTDDPNHPYASSNPVAVYCDVLVYTQMPGSKFYYLKTVLVTQPCGGLQRGPIWKPRASSIDVTGNTVDPNIATNPANLDGDHVLITFIDGQSNQPVIIGSVPHPSRDIGNANKPVGARLKLQLADGDPNFVKHHGTYFGVDDAGDFMVDTTFANGGTLDMAGNEPAPDTTGTHGNHIYNFEQHCQRLVSLMNMSTPTSPTAVMTELLSLMGYALDFMSQTPAWQIKAGANNVLQLANSGTSTTLQVGDGSHSVTIYEHLQNFYNNALTTYLSTHTHPTSTGPSGPPTQTVPSWDTTIRSSKVTIPDG